MLFLYPFAAEKKKESIKKLFEYSLYLFSSIIILLILLIIFDPDNIYVKRFINITALFYNPRWLLWRDSFKIFLKYPVTGSGISTFPNAFENVYTMEFKHFDVRSNYDNAHSNFVQILCTMGIIGITAYLLLLSRTLIISFKSIFSKKLSSSQKLHYIPFVCMISGYIIFGAGDFDDLSIMLYLFIYLAILKSFYAEHNQSESIIIPSKKGILMKPGLVFLFAVFILYFSYNFYITTVHLKADRNFWKILSDLYFLLNLI